MNVVLNLNNQGESHQLRGGEPYQIRENLMLRLDPFNNTLLLENYDSSNIVYVDQRKILEVAQISKGEVFEVNREKYIFLDQMGIYLRPQEEEREGDQDEMLGEVSKITEVDNDASRGRETAGVRRYACLMNIPSGLIVFSVLIILLQAFASNSMDSHPSNPVKVVQNKNVEKQSPVSKAVSQEEVANPDEKKSASQNPATSNLGSVKKTPLAKAVVVKKRKRTRTRPQLKISRTQYHEYVLESRFDPDAALKNFRVLVKKVPRGTKLHSDILKQIANLSH